MKSELGHETLERGGASVQAKKIIAVVDDQCEILYIVESILENFGYQPFCSIDPVEVLNYVTDTDVALLITDIVMPKMSGIELAKEITSRRPNVHVLLMTGYTTEVPHFPVIRKPFRTSELIAAVRSSLDESPGSGCDDII